MVGIVVTWRTNQRRQQKHHAAAAKQRTISPSFSLYKMVVSPAASSPTIKIRISFLEKRLLNKLWKDPILKNRGAQGAFSVARRWAVQGAAFCAATDSAALSFSTLCCERAAAAASPPPPPPYTSLSPLCAAGATSSSGQRWQLFRQEVKANVVLFWSFWKPLVRGGSCAC